MTKKLEKFNRIAKLPVGYIESLSAKAKLQLPFIFYGNILFFIAFILLGCLAVVSTSGSITKFTVIGILSSIASVLFLAAVILIKKQNLERGVYLSTFGILMVTALIVCITPGSTDPLCYYRSGCFIAVMAICNQVVSLNPKQIYIYLFCSIVLFAIGCVIYYPISAPHDLPGTISAIGVNGFAVLITNLVILLMHRFNEEIIRTVIEGQEKVSKSFNYITTVIAESKNGLDVGQKLYEETHRVSTSLSELDSIYSGITKDSKGLFNNTTTISSSSGHVKVQAENMMESVSAQNKSIDETSQGLTEISTTLSNLSGIAEQRGSNMKEMLEILDSEKKLIRKIVEKVSLVKESSDGIAGFVKTVNEIAQQTGVLAMNAAIEASHAGEKGKGFSVIAQEIRKLSEQTTVNAKQIAEKLVSNTDVVRSTTDLVNNFDSYLSRTTEEMRSTIEMLEQLLSGIQSIDLEAGKVMNQLTFAVNKSKETGVMAGNVVREIEMQNGSLAEINSFAEELAESVNGMKNQLDEIKTAVVRIEAEAQSNIQVTERITETLMG